MPELDDRQLDALLRDAAAATRHPASPPLSPRVLAALQAEAWSRAAEPSRRRIAAIAAAVVVGVALAALAVLPVAQTAVAEFSKFSDVVKGQFVEVVPAPAEEPASRAPVVAPTPLAPAVAPTPAPASSPDSTILLASPIALGEAAGALGYEPAIPAVDEEPEGVHLADWAEQPLLIIQYRDFDLWQTRGDGFFGKGVAPSALVEELEVNGEPALWVVSAGHETAFFDAAGNEVLGSRRTVDRNALIWNGEAPHDGTTYYRMETELTLEEALTIARSLP